MEASLSPQRPRKNLNNHHSSEMCGIPIIYERGIPIFYMLLQVSDTATKVMER